MKNKGAIQALFAVAAIYDGVLGLLFLFASDWVFDSFGVARPNHMGYVQFPAALLVTFGLLYLAIARNPKENRNLIPYGMLLKVSYCSVVFWHWLKTDIPFMWKPFAVTDLVFLVLFAVVYAQLRKET
jgi:hypothetical protein